MRSRVDLPRSNGDTRADITAGGDRGLAGNFVNSVWFKVQAEAADDYIVAAGGTKSVCYLLTVSFGHVTNLGTLALNCPHLADQYRQVF
jgi:hypothetical protein